MKIDRKNNFDFLRLILSMFVLVSHSFALAERSECDWLCQITNGQVVFSYLGVKGFFVVSGYLIFQSLQRSRSIPDYFWKRFLRLFPGLGVMLVFCTLFGFFAYDDTQLPYILNRSAWTYPVKNLLIFYSQSGITGIFEKNPLPSVINGSLWTIKYEVTMYILMSVLFILRKNTIFSAIILGIFTVIFILINIEFSKYLMISLPGLNIKNLADLGIFFIAGSFLASIRFEKLRPRNYLTAISLIIALISLCFGFFEIARYFTIPILMIGIGISSWPVLNNLGKTVGDLSYGIYIYGFPVQQALVYFLQPDHADLMIYSMMITTSLAYLSWHIVELKALKLKNADPISVIKKLARG